MSNRRAKFKVGDTVRIDNPEVVERVGYPHTVDDYAEKVWTPDALVALDRLCEALGLRDYERAKRKLKNPLASLLLHKANFGGRSREIRTKREARLENSLGTVTGVRYCITGTYVPGNTLWDGEFYPPELENRKQRRLLEIETDALGWATIEDVNVTLLEPVP